MKSGRPPKRIPDRPLAKALEGAFWEVLPKLDAKTREKLAAHARKLKRPDMAEAILRGGRPTIAPKPPSSDKTTD